MKIIITEESMELEGGNNHKYLVHLCTAISQVFEEMKETVKDENRVHLDGLFNTLHGGLKNVYDLGAEAIVEKQKKDDVAIKSPYQVKD